MNEIDVTLRTEPFHWIEIKGMYTEEEREFSTSVLLNNLDTFKSPNETGSAHNSKNGELLKNNKGVWMTDLVFRNVEEEQRFKEINFRPNHILMDENIWKDSWFYKDIDIDKFQSLFSYYGDGDYYHSHGDSSKITSLSWVNEPPKNYTGGDLIFTDFDMKIHCDGNTTIIFPGNVKHEVNNVSFIDKERIGSGRFAMTTFWGV